MKDLRFWELVLNRPLMSALVALVSSQVWKALSPLFHGRPPELRRFLNYGGFPSTHSAFVGGCALAVGITEGFRSAAFAIAVVAASIFIYDILRLRMTVAQTKNELERLMQRAGHERQEKAPQFGAHSVPEVLAGLAWGMGWALLICLLT